MKTLFGSGRSLLVCLAAAGLLLSGYASGDATVINTAVLKIQEWPEDPPRGMGYRLPAGVQRRREALPHRTAISPEAVSFETANAQLAPFGYRLEPVAGKYHEYDLYRGDERIAGGWWEPPAIPVSPDGKRLALVAGETLLTENGPVPWDWNTILGGPAFVGNDPVWVRIGNQDWSKFQVVRDGQVVYEGALDNRRASVDIEALHAWGDHWVVETVEDQVVIDGKSLNAETGYPEIFLWHLLDGKPFYFYKEDGQYRIRYGEETLPVAYDLVYHNGCCDSAGFNASSDGKTVVFHASRGKVWYYVEISRYH